MTRYRTIVADPPWPYDDALLRRRGDPFLPYQTMTVEAIERMTVKGLAQADVSGDRADKTVPRDGSVLYLWTTTRFLCAAHDVARAWGFVPTAVLVWCKPRTVAMGGTFPANVEFVVYGRRGSPPPAMATTQTRWFTWPRGKHSAKPDAFYDLVEQISPGPYLELFARRQRLGWDTWGNEALEHVSLEHEDDDTPDCTCEMDQGGFFERRDPGCPMHALEHEDGEL